MENLPEQFNKLLDEHNKFKGLVKKMLDAQQAYFRSGKDKQKLFASKTIEKQVRTIVDPPVKKEKTLFDEAL